MTSTVPPPTTLSRSRGSATKGDSWFTTPPAVNCWLWRARLSAVPQPTSRSPRTVGTCSSCWSRTPDRRCVELDLASRAWRTIARANQITGDDVSEAAFTDDASAVVVWTEEEQAQGHPGRPPGGLADPAERARSAGTSLRFVGLPRGPRSCGTTVASRCTTGPGAKVQTLEVHKDAVRDVLVAPTGTWAATAGNDGAVVLWDIDRATGQWSRRETLTGHTGEIAGIELDPTGRILFTAATRRQGDRLGRHAPTPASARPTRAGRPLDRQPPAAGRPDGLLVAPTRPVSRSVGGGGVEALVALDTADVSATFLDPVTGGVVDEVPVGTTIDGTLFGSSVAVSPDGRRVAVTSGFAATVLDTGTREVLGRVVLPSKGDASGWPDCPTAPELVWGAGWTRDGTRLLLGAEGNFDVVGDGGLVVVDPATWRVRATGGPRAVASRPSSRARTAACWPSGGRTARRSGCWTPPRSRRCGPCGWPTRRATFDLSFSADGRWLAAGGDAGLLSVFDTATWRPLHQPVQVDNEFVQQVEWLPDGRTLAASGCLRGGIALRRTTRTGPGPAAARIQRTRRRLHPPRARTLPTSSSCSAGSGPATAIRCGRPGGWPRRAPSWAVTSPGRVGPVPARSAVRADLHAVALTRPRSGPRSLPIRRAPG